MPTRPNVGNYMAVWILALVAGANFSFVLMVIMVIFIKRHIFIHICNIR
jgi:hypothetical protein